MQHTFTHSFPDDPPWGDLEVDLAPPPGATISLSCKDGDIWLQANQAGFLHLARICAELGMHTDFKRVGHHFHRSHTWDGSSGPPEVNFEVCAEAADP